MAQTFTKVKLSGSTDGRMIKISQTSTAGNTVHAAHATSLDEVWLYAVNSSTANVKLTIEFGSTSSPDDTIEVTIPAESGLVCVVPGLILTNSTTVTAFAGTTNVVMVVGFVNRIAG